MFRRKSKELQSLVDSSRKALERAESKIQNRNRLIADMEKQEEISRQANRDLRFELEEKEELINRIEMLVNSNKYNNEKAILQKVKELISDFDG